MTGLEVRGLSAGYGGTRVLDRVDLELPADQLVCILGPSGCGKSTLLRAIAGFHRAEAGRITLNGRVLDGGTGRQVPAEKRRVGYIPQDVALFPHLSVRDNIGFGLPRARRGQRVDELLELIDLADLGKRRPSELSGGQQQRVALARALATDPELLLLDEPFSALDASLRGRVRNDVAELLRRTKTPAILVTHDAEEALAFADVIAVLDGGRIRQVGAPEELHARPVDVTVARALGDANVLPAVVTGAVAATALGEVPLDGPAPDGPTSVLLRPEQLELTSGSTAGVVLRSEFRGSRHRIEVTVAGLAEPLIVDSPRALVAGTEVGVRALVPAHPLV